MSQKNLLTQEGYNSLTEQLNELKKRQEHLITQIEDVAQPDESGEDGLATQLKEELEVTNNQIDEISEALESSQVVNNKSDNDMVQVGSKVKVKISDNKLKFNTPCRSIAPKFKWSNEGKVKCIGDHMKLFGEVFYYLPLITKGGETRDIILNFSLEKIFMFVS